ncbi:hypothetical protein ACMA5I_10360 [Paracoccaceae bacterium GXU_MW_L88]
MYTSCNNYLVVSINDKDIEKDYVKRLKDADRSTNSIITEVTVLSAPEDKQELKDKTVVVHRGHLALLTPNDKAKEYALAVEYVLAAKL